MSEDDPDLGGFVKSSLPECQRRESLLTRSLHPAEMTRQDSAWSHASESSATSPTEDAQVEATLGRPRCIKFACGKAPAPRKTAISFAAAPAPRSKRLASPASPRMKQIASPASPRMKRRPSPAKDKSPASRHHNTHPAPTNPDKVSNNVPRRRRYSQDCGDTQPEERRFHEFATEDRDQWQEESGCHRQRLTVNDTLKKELVIRQIAQEAEEELEEDEDDDQVDDGFQSDNEEGFASDESDDEGWWTTGQSTAATSADLDKSRAFARSVSSSSEKRMPLLKSLVIRNAEPIDLRIKTSDLPDSTDFVCGTLDEDRPLEQAWLERLKEDQAKQELDPSMPMSRPEEEDEEDEDDDDEEDVGNGQENDADQDEPVRGRAQTRLGHIRNTDSRSSSRTMYSPPPPKRLRSPCPRRKKSPARLFGYSPPPPSAVTARRLVSPPPSRRLSIDSGNVPIALPPRPRPTHTSSLPRNRFRVVCSPDDVAGRQRRAIDIVKGLEKKRERRKEKLYPKCQQRKERRPNPGKGAERMRELGLELAAYRGKRHMLSY